MSTQYHPDALRELTDAAQYYERQREGLGSRFLDEVERSEAIISEEPLLWPADDEGRHRCRVRGFPYLLIYRVRDERVYMLAVAHCKRLPGHWHSRG